MLVTEPGEVVQACGPVFGSGLGVVDLERIPHRAARHDAYGVPHRERGAHVGGDALAEVHDLGDVDTVDGEPVDHGVGGHPLGDGDRLAAVVTAQHG